MISYRDLAEASIASQDKFELEQLLSLLDRINPLRILEIGVHRGGMIETLNAAFPSAKIVGIDIDFEPLQFHDFIQVKGDSGTTAIRDKAVKALDYLVDFLFIDGDHNYDAVMRDFDMYRQYVRPGGIIACHDIMRAPERVPHHAGVDCRRFFDEVKLRYPNMEIWNGQAGDDGPGIGVLFV